MFQFQTPPTTGRNLDLISAAHPGNQQSCLRENSCQAYVV